MNMRYAVVLTLMIGHVSVAHAAELNVPSEHPTIEAAMTAAAAGDTILLADGIYSGPGNQGLELASKALTIASASGNRDACIIDALGAGRFIRFASSAASGSVVSGLTIRNGYVLEDGGAGIMIDGAEVIINNCVFRNCVAEVVQGTGSFGGGAIQAAFSGRLTVSNSSFIQNMLLPLELAQGGGGGGGAIRLGTSALPSTIDQCTFTDNSAAFGGALMVNHLSEGHTVTKCLFESNTAYASGGAAVVYNQGGHFNACMFTGNQASFGGAIQFEAGTSTLTDCTFTANHVIAQPTQTGWTGYGGALRIAFQATPNIQGCIFSANTSTDRGGAVWIGGTLTNAQLVQCTFSNNTAPNNGGAAVVGSSGLATFNQCTFTANQAGFGGALHINASAVASVTACRVTNNMATTSGAGMFISTSAIATITNCLLTGNIATFGGGLWVGDAANATVGNCTFTQNSGSGGGIRMGGSTLSTLMVRNSILWNNAPQQVSTVLGTPQIVWSIVQGGWAGTGNLNLNPQFTVSACGDFRPSCQSPAIDSGNSSLVPGGIMTDLCGDPRIFNAVVDRGAHELQFIPIPGDTDCDQSVNVNDLLTIISSWGPCTGPLSCPADVAPPFAPDGQVNIDDLLVVISNWA